MKRYPKPVFYISLYFILILLERFSFIDKKLVLPLAIIITLFITATVIYKIDGFKSVKIFFIILLGISIPMALLYISGITQLPAPWGGVIVVVTITFSAVLIILILFKLNFLKVVFEDDDILIK